MLACGQALMLVSHGEDAKALLARGGVLPSVGALAARTDIAAPLAWDGQPAPGWPGGADMPLKMATVLSNLSYSPFPPSDFPDRKRERERAGRAESAHVSHIPSCGLFQARSSRSSRCTTGWYPRRATSS